MAQQLKETIDKGYIGIGVFVDFLKAFDKEAMDPSVQSDNNLTIVDQVIVIGAPVGSHRNSF